MPDYLSEIQDQFRHPGERQSAGSRDLVLAVVAGILLCVSARLFVEILDALCSDNQMEQVAGSQVWGMVFMPLQLGAAAALLVRAFRRRAMMPLIRILLFLSAALHVGMLIGIPAIL